MDRNREQFKYVVQCRKSLSARRAWIEICPKSAPSEAPTVALRKESVDRNEKFEDVVATKEYVALRKESVDRNLAVWAVEHAYQRRSPQGERG